MHVAWWLGGACTATPTNPNQLRLELASRFNHLLENKIDDAHRTYILNYIHASMHVCIVVDILN